MCMFVFALSVFLTNNKLQGVESGNGTCMDIPKKKRDLNSAATYTFFLND